ncbi:MAG: zinc-dependent metalloprotease [Bacteroidota bacterium]
MRKILFTLLAVCLMIPAGVIAQHGVCGTMPNANEVERLRANILNSDVELHKSGGVIFVPVTFHLVAETNGSGRIDEEPVLDNLCKLNTDYAPYGMQFFKHGEFNLINNSGIYASTASPFVIALNKVPNTINVFIGNTTGGGGCFGVLGFYSPSSDYIFMTSCTVNGSSFALSHEVGHFFSLQHTFFGWEDTDYTPGQNAPFLVSYIGQSWDVEKAARTGPDANCDDSADLFCDTPPDYNFGLGWPGPVCNYTANALDPLGVPVDPMEENFMGYFFGCASYAFSPGQEAAVFADHASRTFLTGNPGGDITSEANLLSPINTTVLFNSVNFSWSSVTNATEYQIEVNRTPTFIPNFIVDFATVSTNSYTSTALLDNQTYYWRVRPINNYDTCMDFNDGESFMTGTPTSVNEIPGVNGFNVYPNPAERESSVNIDLNIETGISAEIKVYSLSGQVINAASHDFQSGSNSYQLSTASLQMGMYIISIQAEEGVIYKKLLISE